MVAGRDQLETAFTKTVQHLLFGGGVRGFNIVPGIGGDIEKYDTRLVWLVARRWRISPHSLTSFSTSGKYLA